MNTESVLYLILVLRPIHHVNTLTHDILIATNCLLEVATEIFLHFQLFKKFFETNTTKDPSKDTATIMTIEGRAFPVDVFYVKQPVADYMMATVKTVLAIHREEGPGDVLAFLTGQEEVEKAVAELK